MILTPDQRLRVFVSSTLGELKDERAVVRAAIESLRLAPVMFEMGARPHPPRALYRAYLEQSHVFLAIYANRYGWVAPSMDISGLEDEYRLSGDRPKLVYVLDPAPERDEQLSRMLDDVAADPTVRLRLYRTADDLAGLVADDLAALLAESFAQREAAAQAPPTVATESAAARELPVPTSSLVGREADVDAVVRLVLREDSRMVTITGMGGIGKSRLALEVAHLVEAEFESGVVMVPLAEVPEPGLVISSIANRLGIRLDTAKPSLDVVAESLAERGDILLLLDNAEQVRDAADDLAALIGTCPMLTVLVTSRSRLRLVAEFDYPLQPLGLGEPVAEYESFGVPPGEAEPRDRGAEQSPAVRLFLERARASRPDLDLAGDPVQLAAVVELCRRLEGLPLAIEIAAARVRLLAPEQLLERLDRRLDLPSSRLSDVPERQRTLRSTLDWSHDLLSPDEQSLLAQLSTFVGGASLSAIEQVVRTESDVLEALASLADHSLLEVEATAIDSPRFTMLETVRDYARERLEASGRAAEVDLAHRQWVLALSDAAKHELVGSGHAQWLDRLERESGNIRAAGSRANAEGDPATLVGIAYCLWLWLWARHHTREARLWLERALDSPTPLDDLTRARLLWALAGAGVEQGDNESSLSRLPVATALFTELEDAEGLALCGFLEASLAPLNDEHDRAVEVFTRAEGELLGLGNVFIASICASTGGMILAQQGRFDEAESYLDRALAQAESIDSGMLRGVTLVARGFARLGRGVLDESGADFAAGAAWSREAGNPESLSFACDGLAAVLLARGQAGETAAALVGAAHGLRDRIGIVPWPGLRPVMAAIADGVRATAGDEVYDAGVQRGKHLGLDAILDLAVQVGAPSAVEPDDAPDVAIPTQSQAETRVADPEPRH